MEMISEKSLNQSHLTLDQNLQDLKILKKKPGTKVYRTKVYFAHPYASSERVSNEKCNQLIRYYIPKGTDINSLDISLIKYIKLGINNKKKKNSRIPIR